MVISVKANKNKILAILALIAVIICGVLFFPEITQKSTSYDGETFDQRVEFISLFGWDISSDPVDTRDVTIPSEFSEVYEKYNQMQIAQGFDLAPYKGMICTQYIYKIENYPNSSKEINITLLVYEGVIIGGDVSCAEVDGFMHGFDIDSKPYGFEEEEEEESSDNENLTTGGKVINE